MGKLKNKITELQTEHENLSFSLEVKSSHEEDDEKGKFGFFEGFAATFSNIDLVNDRIEPGAFEDSLRDRPEMPLLFQHDFRDIIGTIVEAKENKDGLFVKGRVNLGTQKGRDAFALLKAGDLKTMSIGFNVVDREFEKDTDIRILKKIDLHEISLVTFAANPEAQVTGVKSIVGYKNFVLADKDTDWDADAAIEHIKQLKGYVDEEGNPTAEYKNAFVFYNTEELKDFDSYKLPIADVIDGSLKAVPAGIFEAARVLHEVKGDVHDRDTIEELKNHLNRYYSRMVKKFDDASIIPPWKKSLDLKRTVSGETSVQDGHSHDFVIIIREDGSIDDTETAPGDTDRHTHTITGDGETGKTNDHAHIIDLSVLGEEIGKGIDELESIKDIEQALKSKGFTKPEAKTLISKIKEFMSKRDVENDSVKEQNERDVSSALDSINNFVKQLKKDRKNV